MMMGLESCPFFALEGRNLKSTTVRSNLIWYNRNGELFWKMVYFGMNLRYSLWTVHGGTTISHKATPVLMEKKHVNGEKHKTKWVTCT